MKKISDSTISRLSKYYRTLGRLIEKRVKTVSSDEIAEIDGVTSAQVRKDLSFFGTFGKRGLGYNTVDLQNNIGTILGLYKKWNVALVGIGNIGRALVDYQEFKKQGFIIKLLLDNDEDKIGTIIGNLEIMPFAQAVEYLEEEKIQIAIVAVPGNVAQGVVNSLTDAGVKAILNFSPLSLKVPKGVMIKNENMSIELEALSYFLTNRGK
ncbi:MAG: redox-sensing transcriptional repressor Rex [Calditrichia bacterium]|jgi:redox-sensing transcriptional repressor|nr:redox-sensing transcriptional repressor Rex [Calditrichia bacterium]